MIGRRVPCCDHFLRPALAAAIALALATSACGRRGAPEPPGPPRPAADTVPDLVENEDPITGRSPLDQRRDRPNRPFFLDPLL